MPETVPPGMPWQARFVLDDPELFVLCVREAQLTEAEVRMINRAWVRGEHCDLTVKIAGQFISLGAQIQNINKESVGLRDAIRELGERLGGDGQNPKQAASDTGTDTGSDAGGGTT